MKRILLVLCLIMAGGIPSIASAQWFYWGGVARFWMNSPPHRAILMSPAATTITVGSFGAFHTARVR